VIVNLHRTVARCTDPDGVPMVRLDYECEGEVVLSVDVEARRGRTFDRTVAAADSLAVHLAEACVAEQLRAVTPTLLTSSRQPTGRNIP